MLNNSLKLSKMLSQVGEGLAVVGLYTLLALIFTYPLVLNYSDYIVGHMESDVWKHLWGFWWVRRRLIQDCVLPLHTFLLNFPYGGALYFIDSLNGVLSVPLQSFLSIVQTFNTIVIFNLVLAASGTYVLVKGMTAHRAAAFSAGAVYAFSAYMGSSIASGITESINIGYLPFFCHYFMCQFRTRSYKDAFLAALFFSLNTLGCWYFGTFAVLFAVFYYVWLLYKRLAAGGCCSFAKRLKVFLSYSGGSLLYSVFLLAVFVLFAQNLLQTAEHLHVGFILFADFNSAVFGPLIFAAALCAWAEASNKPSWLQRHAMLIIFMAQLLLSLTVGPQLWAWGEWGWRCNFFTFALAVSFGWLGAALSAWAATAYFYGSARASVSNSALQSSTSLWLNTFLDALAWPQLKLWLWLVFYVASFGVASLAFYYGSAWGQGISGRWLVGGVWLVLSLTLYRYLLSRTLQQTETLSLLERFCRYHLYSFTLAVGVQSLLLFVLYISLARTYPWWQIWLFWLLGATIVECLAFFSRKWSQALEQSLQSVWHVSFNEAAALYWHNFFKVPFFMVCLCLAFILGPMLAFQSTINAGDSIVFRGRSEMNVDLHLSRQFYNVMTIKDFLVGGKERAVESYTVDRLIRACYIGWGALFLAFGGCFWGRKRLERSFWVFIGLIFMIFTTGPFMYISDEIYSTVKSPLYMLFFRYFPTFAAVSIPFRFSVLVMLSVSILSAYTLADLAHLLGKKEHALVCASFCMAVLFEVAVFSPSPFPLPLSEAHMPRYCLDIAQKGGDYGLIDFPIQRTRGELLPGEYFFYQIGHLKAIPNRVEGTIPLFVYQNALTSYLFILEHSQGDIPYRSKEELDLGFSDLQRFRFRYLVVHDNYLRRHAKEKVHNMLRFYCGEPKHYPKGIYVYTIPAISETKAR